MAVGQVTFPFMHPVKGIQLGTCNAGIKQTQRDDVLVMAMADAGHCAAVFTQNAFCAAPVLLAREHLTLGPRWLLVNSGNANAGTGKQGLHDAFACCAALADEMDGIAQQVLPFSTGVIGEPLPVGKLTSALPKAVAALDEVNWDNAARAIMTTDSFPKGASTVIEIGGHPVVITGIAKGAGMIQPNMATMLSFIATDAKIDATLLQHCLFDAAEASFNRITVDGDTSTNDACVLLASGCSAAPTIQADTPEYKAFATAVTSVAKRLAELIIRDGEGATKLIRIVVEQAASAAEALQVGKTIAHSPLVKTAFFASDPNWGRILAAVGRAGVQNMVLEAIEIYLGNVCIVENGGRSPGYTEQDGQRVMKQEEISITVRLGRGNYCEEVLTCDFSYDYVKINAEYRT
ncbi:MAG: bifunctional ornithine acetyltransferase/N-acetylglutamate synthase [Methylomonas sp.]|nr:MAG: bifunctional ornithine acetyltransferase/N-acetylglutamate synthase [Methylomonas sp.]PPD27012.1 MAG: bifunctional ornithine acetyltransferase/N-acetylglutamate synthase [Methylomonas sp.]PPD38913.1 MAG: bifunctional ornithine acetyltransferase/N-acetylglutamate synthase [Methylomonas sp.]PPD42614.1 MAG: bifunctional ornithine acetyltransferase/N-acetylglutamate synthase [Methylomonas sp.]PPD54214.1 MAG: bifunctional ornithine acetyltransferase/N-acetylglutamate synthase [Methylomonas s